MAANETGNHSVSLGIILDWIGAVLLLCLLVHTLQTSDLSIAHIAACLSLSAGSLLVVFGNGSSGASHLIRYFQAAGMVLFAAACVGEIDTQYFASMARGFSGF